MGTVSIFQGGLSVGQVSNELEFKVTADVFRLSSDNEAAIDKDV